MYKFSLKIKKVYISLTIGLILVLSFSQLFTNTANAAIGINRQINFQGKLVNNPSATNVSDTSYTVVFTLYDNASGGTQLWQETQTVTTVDGIFRVALGSVTPFPANFNFNWSGLYLGMKVNSDSEMTPRVQMAAVPFAFNAERVAGLTVQDTSGNASTSGTLQIANTKTVSFADAFTTSGALSFGAGTTGTITLGTGSNTLALATTGNTSLTLPQSGTLCTTASCAVSNWWNQLNGALTPLNSTNDFLLGSAATSSALFSYTGIKTGQTIASVSGSLIVMPNNGYGNVGIGTTNPNYPLVVKSGTAGFAFDAANQNWGTLFGSGGNFGIYAESPGSVTGGYLQMGGSTRADAQKNAISFGISNTEYMRIDGNFTGHTLGNVGIGTTNPASLLHVKGGKIVSEGTSGSFGLVQIVNTSVGEASIVLGAGVTGGIGGTLTSSSNNYLWAFGPGSYSTTPDKFNIGSNGITGNIGISISAPSGNVGIGTTAPIAPLHISSGYANNAALIVNNLNSGDLFAASSSGTTKFTIANSGLISVLGGQTSDIDTLTGTTLKIGASTATTITIGRSTQGITLPGFLTCTLKTDGSGVLTCGTDNTGGAGTSPFAEIAGGVIVSNNSTVDFLVGGQATTSAKFAVLGLAAGTNPQASVSATSGANNGNGIAISGDGSIQSFRNNALILGGATTGNISISPLNGGAGSLLTVNALTTNFGGAITGVTTLTTSGAIAANGGITFDNSTDTLGAFTLGGAVAGGGQNITGLGTINGLAITANTGVITTGTWNATAITYQYGGTGFNTYAQGDLIYASAANTLSKLSITGSSGQCLTSNGTVPSWGSCGSSTGVNWWNQLAGALSPVDTTNDFLLGSTATSSALFSYTGIKTGNTIASVSGNLVLMPNNGWGGKMGIGTTNPTAQLTQVVANGGNMIGLSLTQNDTTNNPIALNIANAGTGNSIKVAPTGVAAASVSTGGAINLTNTNNTGAGLIIYSNAGASTGRLMNIWADNVLFNQPALHIDYDGISNVVEIVNNSTDTSSIALNIVSNNPNDTTLGISGQELGRGTIKVVHTGTGTDGNASAISIDLQGSGTASQGIFMDSTTGGTTGKLLNLRNSGTEYLSLTSSGRLGLSAASPLATLDVRGVLGTIAVASISGTTSFASLIANNDGVGDLFTASSSGTNKFTVQRNGLILAPTYNAAGCTLKADTNGLITCGTDNTGGGGINWWNQLAGTLSPVDTTNDFLIGSTATSSALFSYTGIKTGNTIASVSGSLIVMPNNGYGQVGIGTTNPTALLSVGSTSQFQVNTSGVVASGTWNGTKIGVAYGGTNLTTVAAGSVLAANSLDTLSAITSTTGLKVLQNSAGTTSWATTTGTGNVVYDNTPTLITPVLGAATGTSLALGTNPAAAGTLRLPNATYITARNAANSADINMIQINASNLVTFGANTAAFTLGGTVTGNSQNITGAGAITATSYNGNTFTTGTGTITLAAGKTLTANNTLTFAGTDSTTITFQGTDTYIGRTTTDTLTNKTIGSTGLTFSAAATDIATGTNEDFTITPNGTGKVVIGTTTNGLTFDPAGATAYTGTGRITKRITLTPEYAGASLTADGTSNTGSMTSDNQAASPYRNFYKWTNTQGTAQDYDIWVTVPLPADYSAMAATPTLSIDTYTSDLTNGTVLVTVYDTSNTADCTDVAFTPTGAINTWESKTATTCLDTGTYAANGIVKIKLHVTGAATTGDTRVSTIFFDYLAKF